MLAVSRWKEECNPVIVPFPAPLPGVRTGPALTTEHFPLKSQSCVSEHRHTVGLPVLLGAANAFPARWAAGTVCWKHHAVIHCPAQQLSHSSLCFFCHKAPGAVPAALTYVSNSLPQNRQNPK